MNTKCPFYTKQTVYVTYGFTLNDYTHTDVFNEVLETEVRNAIQNEFGNHIAFGDIGINVYDHSYVDRKTNTAGIETVVDIDFKNEMSIYCEDYKEYITENYIDMDMMNNLLIPIITKTINNAGYKVIEEIGYDNSIDEDLDDIFEQAAYDSYLN